MSLSDPITLRELQRYGQICLVYFEEDGGDLSNFDKDNDISGRIENIAGIHVIGKNEKELISITPVLYQIDENVVVARLNFRRCHRVGECE